jgi:trehalose 6-phosphate phosphatase
VSLGDLAGLRLDGGVALFLDFDGTLAEIAPDPDAVALDEEAARALDALAVALAGAVALVSGRDLRDLAGRTPPGLWRAGGHGLEILAPGDDPPPSPPPAPAVVLAPLRRAAAAPGVRLELKGPVAALHWRAAPEAAGACLEAAEIAAAALPGWVAQAGRMVVEVKPEAASKGRAVAALMARPPFAGRRPAVLGDDATDEEAMEAALALGGVAVKVGDGPTLAALRAPDPAAVRFWLAREAIRLSAP